MSDIKKRIPTNGGDLIEKFGEHWRNQISHLKQKFGSFLLETRFPGEDLTDVPVLYVAISGLLTVLEFLKFEPGFEYDFLSDITATDEQSDPRFEVVYQLFSTTRHWRMRIKVRVREEEAVPSAIPIWKGADWAEREVWDMFGIKFSGHPNLKRILMDNRWEGHPLRKDYPLKGYQIFTDPEPVDPKLLD